MTLDGHKKRVVVERVLETVLYFGLPPPKTPEQLMKRGFEDMLGLDGEQRVYLASKMMQVKNVTEDLNKLKVKGMKKERAYRILLEIIQNIEPDMDASETIEALSKLTEGLKIRND